MKTNNISKSSISEAQGQFELFDGNKLELLDTFSDDQIVDKAYKILEQRAIGSKCDIMSSPECVKRLFQLRHTGLKREEFNVAYLNQANGLLEVRTEFVGDISSCTVHVKPILRSCIETNAASILLGHSHPSNISCLPSRADIDITHKLSKALSLYDISVLDHIITVDGSACSLAERGEM